MRKIRREGRTKEENERILQNHAQNPANKEFATPKIELQLVALWIHSTIKYEEILLLFNSRAEILLDWQ